MLLPTTVMASSIRPGSRVTHKSLNSSPSSKYDGALCKKEDRFTEKCDIIIDDTGVRGPEGHITTVVRWSSKEDAPSAGGAVAGAAGGAIVGGAAGIGTCFLVGPLCLITAPAIMGGGMGTGAEWGAKSGARTFTIVGDDAQGERIIQFFKVKRSGVEKTEEQLLKPLKMNRSSTMISGTKKIRNVSTPHQEIDGELKEIAWRDIDNVGPAGSINSSVKDMSNWVMMLLNEGSFNGKQILTAQTVTEMFMPQQVMRKEGRLGSYFPPVQFLTYGLGWFISDFNGYKVVEHGGNIDGMHAQVTLVPELELGITFLSNRRNLLPEAARYYIIETFADIDHKKDWNDHFLNLAKQTDELVNAQLEKVENGRVLDSDPSLNLKGYIGKYAHPMYGDVNIKLKGKSLRYEGHKQFQGVATHWHHNSFELQWDQERLGKLIITFEIDAMGNVKGVEIPGKGFHRRKK